MTLAKKLEDGRQMALSAAVHPRVADTWFWGICAIFVATLDREYPGWRTWSGATMPCYEHAKPAQTTAAAGPTASDNPGPTE